MEFIAIFRAWRFHRRPVASYGIDGNSKLDDETLAYAGRISSGETDALFEYIEKNRPQLLAYIGKNLSDSLKRKVEAEDILQEAAVSCLNAFDSIDFQKIDMFSWICQQCQRRIIDSHRHFFGAQKRDAAKEIGLNNAEPGHTADGGLGRMIAASITSPSAAFSKQQKEFQLQNMIGQLSEDAQTVLKLRFVEGLATKEIAQRMDRSDASVRVLLTRTVKKLQADVGLEHLTD